MRALTAGNPRARGSEGNVSAYAHRAAYFGWVGGGLGAKSGSSAPAGAAVVGLSYARALRAGPAAAQFTATVNGTPRGVAGVVVGGTGNKSLLVTLASALAANDNVVVTYAPGGTPATRLAYTTGEELSGGSTTVKSV